MKPIFCGNFDFEARSSDLERLFRRYGKVDRVDMKSGFAFIYMDDERDADYAIRALDRTEFGRKGRRLRVEWTKHDQVGRKPVSSRKSSNLRPSKTLFVINFPHDTQTRDLERHFDPYGKINNVRIRKNFAFIEYESLDDAIRAIEATHMSKFMDRVITVEYSARGGEDNNRKNGCSPDRRDRDRSLDRSRHSPSPYRRPRRSPDYGTGSSPLAHRRDRGSPLYGNGSSCSPRRVERASPVYNRKRSPSPRRDERASPEFRGRDREIRGHGRSGSRSPRRDVRASPEFRGRDREIPVRGRSRSCSPRGGERNGNGYPRRPSLSGSEREEGAILDDDLEPLSRIGKSDSRDRPIVGSRSPIDMRHSRSPLAWEQSPS